MKYIHTGKNIPEENEYPKLVRDKIPEIIKKNDGIDADITSFQKTDKHILYLRKKVVEEASELCEATDKEHLVEEMADVLEVIDAMCAVAEIDKNDVISVQKQKRDKRGGFTDGLVMNQKV